MSIEAPAPAEADERQVTLDLLKAFTPAWLKLRLRNERGLGGDPVVRRDYTEAYAHMNDLLDQLGVTDGIE